MTRSEYLEFVQEALSFPPDMPDHIAHMDAKPGLYPCHPDFALRDTPEVCKQLQTAHKMYCGLVEAILFPDRPRTPDVGANVALMDSVLSCSKPMMTPHEVDIRPCECNGVCDGACVR